MSENCQYADILARFSTVLTLSSRRTARALESPHATGWWLSSSVAVTVTVTVGVRRSRRGNIQRASAHVSVF